jgi:hypothetical protein
MVPVPPRTRRQAAADPILAYMTPIDRSEAVRKKIDMIEERMDSLHVSV